MLIAIAATKHDRWLRYGQGCLLAYVGSKDLHSSLVRKSTVEAVKRGFALALASARFGTIAPADRAAVL